MLTFIDTHAHLNSKQYNLDLVRVITSAKKAGVKKIIVPGFDIQTSEKSSIIAQRYKDYCYATCGIHPYHANKVTDLLEAKDYLEKIIKTDTITAVGEVGLDYHLFKNEKAEGKKIQQKELLKIEIELALKYRLPLILHCREAWDDLLDILAQYINDGISGVSHCFEGGKYHLSQILKLGLFIGFNGMLTFNSRLPELVSETPIERILLETDSPFLTPEPNRGHRNEPKYVRIVAYEIARIKNINKDEVANQTTLNAESLFRLY